MNAAGDYHGQSGEQGDPLEASMAPGVCLYRYACLPIYCMYTNREKDIIDNTVKIPMRMIQEFGCADGWIGIVQYDSFARLADRHIADDGNIYVHGPVSYGVPGPKLIREIFEGIPHNLVIKTPRTHIKRSIESSGRVQSNVAFYQTRYTQAAKIEEYGHAELDLGSSLADFSRMGSVSSLEEAEDDLMLKQPHCV